MKQLLLAVGCMLSFSIASYAQTSEPSKEALMAQRAASLAQVSAAAQEVGLEEKKTVQLKAIFEQLFKKIDEIKADGTSTDEDKKEKLKAANAEKDWKVKNLLGDKYKAYSEVRKRLATEAAPPKQ